MLKAALKKIAARLRLRTRYTRALEDEIARLRAENRALINSILGVAGIPPMRAATLARVALADGAAKNGQSAITQATAAVTCTEVPLRSVRRRSWRQVGRAFEVKDAKAARRERESDTETFPTPRNVVGRLS